MSTKKTYMSNDDMCNMVLLICVLCFCSFIGGICVGRHDGRNSCREEAKEAKVGEYYLDKNNDKQFRFIKPVKIGK